MHVRCHGCDYRGVLARRAISIEYHLEDDSILQTARSIGWCDLCNAVCDIEPEFDVEALQSQLDRLVSERRRIGAHVQIAMDRFLGRTSDLEGRFSEVRRHLALARERRSPPRCLACESSSVAEIRFDEQGTSSDFVHTCGSHLYLVPEDPDAPRFFYRPEVVALDSDGRRLNPRGAPEGVKIQRIAEVAGEFAAMSRSIADSLSGESDVLSQGDNATLYVGFSCGAVVMLCEQADVEDGRIDEALVRLFALTLGPNTARELHSTLHQLLESTMFRYAIASGKRAVGSWGEAKGAPVVAGKALATLLKQCESSDDVVRWLRESASN
jgi:hypothetical protein